MSEELQRYRHRDMGRAGYVGDALDRRQHFRLGSTTWKQLQEARIIEGFTCDVRYKPRLWPGRPSPGARPDEIVVEDRKVVLVVERKRPSELDTPVKEEKAAEQCLVYTQQARAKLGVVTDDGKFIWIHNLDPDSNELRYVYDSGELFQKDYREPGVLEDVLNALDLRTDSLVRPAPVDPTDLADKVWQTIWLATHEDERLCLATFVELFVYKFLSDLGLLPDSMRMAVLDTDESGFTRQYGRPQIEYYVQSVRPVMKQLFPEGAQAAPPVVGFEPGSGTTSIVDNFAFAPSERGGTDRPLGAHNHEFLDIIRQFCDFGPVTHIDTEFKSHVYEKFLKQDVRQHKLGQYLTPRNVVRAVVGMAQPERLLRQGGAVICDPACGVGGFLLEPLLHAQHLSDNLVVERDRVSWRISLVGLEVDRQTNILSKANMLIHLAERYTALSDSQKDAFAKLMNNTFVLCDHDPTLGALEFPQSQRFNLVMTNPPFVVRGTSIIKAKIDRREDLSSAYAKSGTGVESLFLRHIIDSLVPGGRAFVVVPTGILTRSETAMREYIRDRCIVDGIISLPERTFYNTPNRTYILAMTKKVDRSPQDEHVFAFLVREVGETRDTMRFPCRSDLPDLVRQFRMFYADKGVFEPRNLNCKVLPVDQFDAGARWDVDRFWTDDEKRELGIEETKAMSVEEFESVLDATVSGVKAEIDELRDDAAPGQKHTEIALGDAAYFTLMPGQRVTRTQIHDNPGAIPVISGRRVEDSYLGMVSEEWLREQGIPIWDAADCLITVAANGSVGTTYLRREEKYAVHDDVNIVRIADERLYPPFIVYALREAIASARFRYDAKLYASRLRALRIRVPIGDDGGPDWTRQVALADQNLKLETLKESVIRLAKELADKVLVASTTDADPERGWLHDG